MQRNTSIVLIALLAPIAFATPDVLIEGESTAEVLRVENTSGKDVIHAKTSGSGAGYASTALTGEATDCYNCYGVSGNAHGAHTNYGANFYAAGGASGNTGVYASASGSGTTNYGILATAAGTSSDNYAGVFYGDVIITGDCDGCSTSDAKFKTGIQDLTGGMSKIMAMKPKTYFMLTDEFSDRIALGKRKQFGLLAQDLEAVLPEAAHDVRIPALMTASERKNKVEKPPVDFKAVNYRRLIPVLIAAMQEQQGEIEALRQEVQRLKGE